jgi:hypothetical protein
MKGERGADERKMVKKIPQTEYAGAEGWPSRHDFSTCVAKALDAFHCEPF